MVARLPHIVAVISGSGHFRPVAASTDVLKVLSADDAART
jgi:hypothetical protein